MKREFLQSLKVGQEALPKEVVDAIMAENGKDIHTHKQAAQQWEEKYNQAVSEHTRVLAQMEFDSMLSQTVSQNRGRSLKAITALLDIPALTQSQDPQAAIAEAVSGLKQEHGYLFDSDPTPTPYARGAGTQTGGQDLYPQTLAGALKERFTKI